MGRGSGDAGSSSAVRYIARPVLTTWPRFEAVQYARPPTMARVFPHPGHRHGVCVTALWGMRSGVPATSRARRLHRPQ